MSSKTTPVEPTADFESLGLIEPILTAVKTLGYEQPSPIQRECIPLLLQGRDLIGQAQTGTGKTAAFALPILSQIDTRNKQPQVLVLAPTRELAIQVAEAIQSYARNLPGFHVLPIYGGQSYDTQLRQLKRGVQVVVGTPGRVMDHIRRKTLKLDGLTHLVLDEADEMLRMGFIDDVEWILEQTPKDRQIALFSATMPPQIRKVAERYLNDPKQIKIVTSTSTATTIRQRYWRVSGMQKLDALTRILEVERFDAILIFVRTKTATVELAEKLSARGHSCAALNGDIPQQQRERTVDKIKRGQIDILVATDVAARGLDLDRVSHVINYDIPYDTEAYVHRIGRTGRAGRSGEAILFVAPRETRLLKAIEKATRQPIESMQVPSAKEINLQRIERFKQDIADTIANENLATYDQLLSEFQQEQDASPMQIAAALAAMLQGKTSLLLSEKEPPRQERKNRQDRQERPDRERSAKGKKDFSSEKSRSAPDRSPRKKSLPSSAVIPLRDYPDVELQRFTLQVGSEHGVQPGNIVGAIANEADIESCYIGHIEIMDTFSTVDLPAEMPKDIFQLLKKARVCGQKLDIDVYTPGNTQGNTPGNTSDNNDASAQKTRSKSSEKTSSDKKPSKKKSSGKKFVGKSFAEKRIERKKTADNKAAEGQTENLSAPAKRKILKKKQPES